MTDPAAKGRSSGPNRSELYKLAYEEGKRTVDDQLAELDSMRQRSVQFLAFVGASTAFLVGTGLRAPSRSTGFYLLASIATLSIVVSILLCSAILVAASWRGRGLQIEDWSFRLSAKSLVQWIEPDVKPPSESDYFRALALRYNAMADENAPRLSRMRRHYIAFLVFGFLQLGAWVALVWIYGAVPTAG